jgi:hypothetical protein
VSNIEIRWTIIKARIQEPTWYSVEVDVSRYIVQRMSEGIRRDYMGMTGSALDFHLQRVKGGIARVVRQQYLSKRCGNAGLASDIFLGTEQSVAGGADVADAECLSGSDSLIE